MLLTQPIVIGADFVAEMNERISSATYGLARNTTLITTNVTIDGNGSIIYRNADTSADALFTVTDGYTLTLTNITVDGGEMNHNLSDGVDGVINFGLSTNHNTAYLAEKFGELRFSVNESAANFSQFNFKPAAGYTYTEGDEAKLVCMNEGYSTYWDAATSTFRLQAD